LNFKLTTTFENLNSNLFESYDILFFYQDYLQDISYENILKNTNKIKILGYYSNDIPKENFNYSISLPIQLSELNKIIENSVVKKSFSNNSSIKIKNYILDKNEKKLFQKEKYILLTEKEIQLLELFLAISKPISKNEILKEVWKYSTDADTHTVETHIYRLRKKIKSNFLDENFIINTKNGYFL